MARVGVAKYRVAKYSRIAISALAILCLWLLLFRNGNSPASKNGKYSSIQLDTSTLSWSRHQLRHFKIVDRLAIFLYSAIANYQQLNIIISGFDSTDTDSLLCCVLMGGDTLFTSQASVFYKFYNEPSFIGPYVQRFYTQVSTNAKQYACVVPDFRYKASHVTLTSSTCPVVLDEYLPIIYPQKVPGGLAICGKAAFGDQLDARMLMEWFEVQRLLGVDHIQLMDAGNPPEVQKVFQYYKDTGLLNVLPYELPGVPYGRGLDVKRWVKQQGDHDKSFPILDCTQRLKGYTYVMGIDMDEVLVPAKHDNIKDFLQEKLSERPDAAGFFFYTQFFVYDWGPTNSNSNVTIFKYLNSTLPRNECKKYIYATHRIFQARTHDFSPRNAYRQYWVPAEEAVLHHYRKCPKNVWSTCYPEPMTDLSILRLQGKLEPSLEKARQTIGI